MLSRGVAQDTPETHAAVKQLLPDVGESVGLASIAIADFNTEVATSNVYRVLVKCKSGLAPCPSGLRTDQLHDILELDNDGPESGLAALLTELMSKLVNALLPQ